MTGLVFRGIFRIRFVFDPLNSIYAEIEDTETDWTSSYSALFFILYFI